MGEPAIEPVAEPTAEPVAEPTDWKQGISEDFRGDENLNNIKDVNDLAKNYLSLNRMMGSRIKIPGEDASTEDKTAFNAKLVEIPGVVRLPEDGDKQGFDELYAKLGRPETHEQYTYESPEMPAGLEGNKDIADWFNKSAHEAGASNAFVTKIRGEWDQMLISQQNEKQQAMDGAEAGLHKDWGNDYPRRMGAARALVTKYGSAEVDEAIEASGLGNNPFFNKMMSDIAMNNLEDSAINSGLQTASETPVEIKEKINETMNHPAYLNNMDPQHNDIVAKVFKLRQQLTAIS